MGAAKKSSIGNPLRTRVLRELISEWKKYIVIFIFLTLMIGFISGMYVANNSLLAAAEKVKSAQIREDGHFVLKEKADDDLYDDIEEGDKVDALTFDVAMATKEGWDRINSDEVYEYAWLYEETPADVRNEKRVSDNFLKALITQAAFADNEIEDFVPEYANAAIQFAPDDFGADRAMGGVILNILVVVLAFIFGVTESNTIAKEAPVIGTMRASGYTRRELTINYLEPPIIVTLLGATVGNILGYTFFKNVVSAMYFNSYSLPKFDTVWTSEAFVRTTVIPIIMMLVINWFIIKRKMRFSPLRFLRNDLTNSRRKRSLKLPDFTFIRRFRMRIFLQNIAGYFMLFVGIGFVMVMLAMAVGMPDTLSWYQEHADEMMLADYQLVLTSDRDEDGNKIETSNPDAEKFSMEDLVYDNGGKGETVTAYGMEPGNRYIDIPSDMEENEICLSTACAYKYNLEEGDEIRLREKFGYDSFDFRIKKIVDFDSGVSFFTDIDNFNALFDRREDSYNGYFSDSEITDIDDDFVAAVVTSEDIHKMAAQLDHSMGAYMLYFQYLCILLSAVLIFLLTKVIVERNEKSISMVKILGYTDREVAGLYLVTTTMVVIVSEIITVFAAKRIMSVLWKLIMSRLDGYFPFVLSPTGMLRMCVLVFLGYLLVMLVDFRRIRRIPMDQALKDME